VRYKEKNSSRLIKYKYKTSTSGDNMSTKYTQSPAGASRRKLLKGAAATAGIAALGLPAISLAQNKPIRIGMPTILSGRVAMLGFRHVMQ
jgi:hypothetical protein